MTVHYSEIIIHSVPPSWTESYEHTQTISTMKNRETSFCTRYAGHRISSRAARVYIPTPEIFLLQIAPIMWEFRDDNKVSGGRSVVGLVEVSLRSCCAWFTDYISQSLLHLYATKTSAPQSRCFVVPLQFKFSKNKTKINKNYTKRSVSVDPGVCSKKAERKSIAYLEEDGDIFVKIAIKATSSNNLELSSVPISQRIDRGGVQPLASSNKYAIRNGNAHLCRYTVLHGSRVLG